MTDFRSVHYFPKASGFVFLSKDLYLRCFSDQIIPTAPFAYLGPHSGSLCPAKTTLWTNQRMHFGWSLLVIPASSLSCPDLYCHHLVLCSYLLKVWIVRHPIFFRCSFCLQDSCSITLGLDVLTLGIVGPAGTPVYLAIAHSAYSLLEDIPGSVNMKPVSCIVHLW